MNDSLDRSSEIDPIEESMRASLPQVCWAVSAILLGLCAFHASFLPANWKDRTILLTVVAAVVSACVLAYGCWLTRGRSGRVPVHVLAMCPFLLVLANSLLPVMLDPRPFRYVTIAFCAVGAGCVFVSRRWLTLAIACCLCGWLIFTASLWGELKWIRLTSVLIGSAVAAFVIQAYRRAALGQLIRANATATNALGLAERASAAKTRFLANTSHELRTPLAAIIGYSEVLTNADDTAASGTVEFARAVHGIHRNAHHLLALVNDTLDLVQIESGGLQVDHQPTSPTDIAREAFELVRREAEKQQLGFNFESNHAVPALILTDPTRLRQILVNLLANAVKFTPSGSVSLRLDATSDVVRFEVRDTGIGIPEPKQDQIFDAFRQADVSTTRKYGGSGLGLAISRRLALALGGRLDLESVLGDGSVFSLDLPYDTVDVAPHSETALEGLSLAHRRILVAEDCEDLRQMIALFLRKAGAEVVVVGDGRQAVERAFSEPGFDLILMDLQMPVLDGADATSKLRAGGHTGPIVALTASALAEERQRCTAIGFDDYATKPIARSDLIRLASNWSQSAVSMREACRASRQLCETAE